MSIAEDRSQGGGKRERTRAALIAATLEVVEAEGFAGASLDAIAAKAGMTKGAIYSNFTGKAELMMAAMGARGLRLDPSDYSGGTLRAGLTGLAKDLAAMIRRARGDARFAVEFQLYAMGDPELRAGMAETYAAAFGQSADFFAAFEDLKPGVSGRHVAVALQSLALGLTAQSFVTPDEITDDLVLVALTALADGVTTLLAQGADGAV
jgi:AcrR family transcriptional regulator